MLLTLVPVKMSKTFPFDTFTVMGLLRTAKDMKPGHLESMIGDMFDLIWQHGNTEVTPELLEMVMTPYFDGQEMSLLMKRASDPHTRETLRNEAKRLVARGAFGFPYVSIVTSLTLDGLKPHVPPTKSNVPCTYIPS